MSDINSIEQENREIAKELSDSFSAERALAAVNIKENVLRRLPQTNSVLLRFSRAFAVIMVFALLCCTGLAVVVITGFYQDFSPLFAVRMFTGACALVMAVFLNFAAPRIVLWDAKIMKKITGKFPCPGIWDVVLVRSGAFLLSIISAGLFLFD